MHEWTDSGAVYDLRMWITSGAALHCKAGSWDFRELYPNGSGAESYRQIQSLKQNQFKSNYHHSQTNWQQKLKTNDGKLWWELTCAPLNPPQPDSLCSPSLLIKLTVLEWLLFQLPSNKWQPLSVMSSYGLGNTPFTNIRDRLIIGLANYWHF